MGKREEFINLLDKYELAFLYKYKIDTYMSDTQDYIKEIMTKKGVFEEIVDDLIEEKAQKAKELNLGGCQRCHSDKFFYFETIHDNMSREVAMWDDNRYSTEMPTDINQECAVCGYNEIVKDVGKGKNKILKNVLIVLALMYGLAKLIIWFFEL
jgi:hypothetical protein